MRRKKGWKLLSVNDRFWGMVEKTDGCWLWLGSLRETGYGQFNNDGKITRAHRFAYELAYGAIPDDMLVCHHCDNRRCVRPDHLFVGTHKDNMQDCLRKGRYAGVALKGEDQTNAKLTWVAVREMRDRYRGGGVSQPELARQYGVSQAAVNSVLLNKTWRER